MTEQPTPGPNFFPDELSRQEFRPTPYYQDESVTLHFSRAAHRPQVRGYRLEPRVPGPVAANKVAAVRTRFRGVGMSSGVAQETQQ